MLDVPPSLSKHHIKRSIELDGDKLVMLNEIRDKVSRVFRKACDVIGVSKGISFHSLRHTFACIRRLQDDFPTYAKSAKNGDVDMLYVDIEPSKLESLIGK